MTQRTVLISLDTLRVDCIGCYPVRLFQADHPGCAAPRTPVLDELAARGAFFRQCISAAPYTSASHGAILTGRFPLENGLFEVYNRRLESPTVFQAARRGGLCTALKSDFPLIIGPDLGFTDDIDHFIVEDDEAFLEQVERSNDFVGLVHFGGIHYPYGFHNLRYGGQAYRAKVEELEARYPVQGFDFKDRILETRRDAEDLDLLLRYKRVVQYLYAERAYRELFELYVQGIEYFLEHRFTPFWRRLSASLEKDSWLVAVFGDHGEQWDDHSYGHHNSLNEGVLRVPLILAGSDVPQGLVYDQRVRTVDLAPTLLEWQGLTPSVELSGRSLWPILRGEPDPYHPRRAYAQAYNCEPDEFVAVQRELLSTGKKSGPLKHVLTQEVVYEGDYRYVRHHRAYRAGTFGIDLAACEELERSEGLGLPVPSQELGRCAPLAALLDAYGARSAVAGTTTPPPALRRFLEDMGYFNGR